MTNFNQHANFDPSCLTEPKPFSTIDYFSFVVKEYFKDNWPFSFFKVQVTLLEKENCRQKLTCGEIVMKKKRVELGIS